MTPTDNLESQNTLNQKMKFIDAIQALPDNRIRSLTAMLSTTPARGSNQTDGLIMYVSV